MTHREAPLLLDLFCGAGGAAVGYRRAGFGVVGVDHRPQPRYPFPFHQADALEVLRHLAAGRSVGPFLPAGRRYWPADFAAVHASPPCQAYSRARHCPGSAGRTYPALVPVTAALLHAAGRPWVLENVEGAPLHFACRLCGTMFGLPLRRHRLFAASILLLGAGSCRHRPGDVTVFGHCVQLTGSRGVPYVARSGRTRYRPVRVGAGRGAAAMGIDWMTRAELAQAVPPAYTEYLGRQLLNAAGG